MRLKTPAGLETTLPKVIQNGAVPASPTINQVVERSSDPDFNGLADPDAPYGRNRDGKPRNKPGPKPPGPLVPLNKRYTVQGSSGLDGSKPNTHVKVFARPYTEEAVLTLAEIMRDTDAPPAVRVSAASQLIDRAWGKAKETLELEAPAEGIRAVLAGVSSSDLSDLLRAVRGQMRPEIDVTPTRVEPEKDKAP